MLGWLWRQFVGFGDGGGCFVSSSSGGLSMTGFLDFVSGDGGDGGFVGGKVVR